MSAFVTEICCNCGIEWGVTERFYKLCQNDSSRWFYCPNGHQQHYADSKTDKLRRERDRLKQDTARLEDEKRAAWAEAERQADARQTAEHRANGFKGVATKLRKRVARGVCPCCSRTFGDLAAHMATKHAGFAAEEVQAEAGRALQ